MRKPKLTHKSFNFSTKNLRAVFLFVVLGLLATKTIPDTTASILLSAGTIYLAVSYVPKTKKKDENSSTPPQEDSQNGPQ